MNDRSDANPAPSAPSTALSRNPRDGIAPRPQVIAANPMATATAPFQSSGFAWSSRLSQVKKIASPAAAIAKGTLIRKIARHDT
jgi:hypothetical protein